LLSPAGSASQISAPYLYRYYQATRAYLGFSSEDNHLYYQGSDGRLQDQGDAIPLLSVSSCQWLPWPLKRDRHLANLEISRRPARF